MREHKFRVWDKSDKRMIVDEQPFVPLLVTNKGILKLSPHNEEALWIVIGGDRFETMQYTGLKDKNGKVIYEGDIIKTSYAFEDDYIGTVKFGEYSQDGSGGEYTPSKCIGFYVEMSEKDKNKMDDYDFEVHRSYYYQTSLLEHESFEIIGNIYENPELLGGAK